jgi:hypothetical protein
MFLQPVPTGDFLYACALDFLDWLVLHIALMEAMDLHPCDACATFLLQYLVRYAHRHLYIILGYIRRRNIFYLRSMATYYCYYHIVLVAIIHLMFIYVTVNSSNQNINNNKNNNNNIKYYNQHYQQHHYNQNKKRLSSHNVPSQNSLIEEAEGDSARHKFQLLKLGILNSRTNKNANTLLKADAQSRSSSSSKKATSSATKKSSTQKSSSRSKTGSGLSGLLPSSSDGESVLSGILPSNSKARGFLSGIAPSIVSKKEKGQFVPKSKSKANMQFFVKSGGCPQGVKPGAGQGEDCSGHGLCKTLSSRFLFLEINENSVMKLREKNMLNNKKNYNQMLSHEADNVMMIKKSGATQQQKSSSGSAKSGSSSGATKKSSSKAAKAPSSGNTKGGASSGASKKSSSKAAKAPSSKKTGSGASKKSTSKAAKAPSSKKTGSGASKKSSSKAAKAPSSKKTGSGASKSGASKSKTGTSSSKSGSSTSKAGASNTGIGTKLGGSGGKGSGFGAEHLSALGGGILGAALDKTPPKPVMKKCVCNNGWAGNACEHDLSNAENKCSPLDSSCVKKAPPVPLPPCIGAPGDYALDDPCSDPRRQRFPYPPREPPSITSEMQKPVDYPIANDEKPTDWWRGKDGGGGGDGDGSGSR